jgi:hypothetical protein
MGVTASQRWDWALVGEPDLGLGAPSGDIEDNLRASPLGLIADESRAALDDWPDHPLAGI